VRNDLPLVMKSNAGLTVMVDGAELQKMRVEHELSAAMLAKRMGVSTTMISKYERERSEVSVGVAEKLYDLFGDRVFKHVNVFQSFTDKGSNDYYAINSSLERYDTFVPYPYESLEQMVAEIILEKGFCRVLEMGCGDGFAGTQIARMHPGKVQYNAISVTEPKHSEDINWIDCDVDTFQPDTEYDLIFSVQGVIYGYNDFRNYFKLANALSIGGKFWFNFDGRTNPINVEKANRFCDFLGKFFLDSLYESGMHSYCDSAGDAASIYYGERRTSKEIDPQHVLERARELEQENRSSYIPVFGGVQEWVSFADEECMSILTAAVKRQISQIESQNKYRPLTPKEEDERERFVKWIADDVSMVEGLLVRKFPIEYRVKKLWHHHPMNAR